MKKILRYVLYLIGAALTLILVFVLFVQFRGIPTYEPQEAKITVVSTPEKVLHGKKLASMLCVKCHLDPVTNQLTGKFLVDAPPIFGKIYSKNITQSKDHGIANWTDGQITYLLRTGVRPDGTFVPPYMPKLVHISDEYIYSIVAYLRSDRPEVQVVKKELGPS